MEDKRVYNMILTKRSFTNSKEETYALLGYENGLTWNLLGGKQDNDDASVYAAAARELYEESGKYFNKRNNDSYWQVLPTYKYTKHTIFIHAAGRLNCNISQLNAATRKCRSDASLPHDFKEMHRYQLIKLKDLIQLAESQTTRGANMTFNHPQEDYAMCVDGWLLFTLKNAGVNAMKAYI